MIEQTPIPIADFAEFPKIARLNREMIVTEKIDGTNATIYVSTEGEVFAASKSKWITPNDDNHGFAAWVYSNKAELLTLGAGWHRGEWWGGSIQRGYGIKEKRFSLFNAIRWCPPGDEPQRIPTSDPRIVKFQEPAPSCCHIVPILHRGPFETSSIAECVEMLRRDGSAAAPGYLKPEGVIAFHIQGNFGLKVTLEKDSLPKSLSE